MSEPKKKQIPAPEDKQHTILPNEADPKFSLPKALSAALKAKGMAKKARRLR